MWVLVLSGCVDHVRSDGEYTAIGFEDGRTDCRSGDLSFILIDGDSFGLEWNSALPATDMRYSGSVAELTPMTVRLPDGTTGEATALRGSYRCSDNAERVAGRFVVSGEVDETPFSLAASFNLISERCCAWAD